MQALLAEKEERKIVRDIIRSKRRVDQYSEKAAELALERRVYKRRSVGRESKRQTNSKARIDIRLATVKPLRICSGRLGGY